LVFYNLSFTLAYIYCILYEPGQLGQIYKGLDPWYFLMYTELHFASIFGENQGFTGRKKRVTKSLQLEAPSTFYKCHHCHAIWYNQAVIDEKHVNGKFS